MRVMTLATMLTYLGTLPFWAGILHAFNLLPLIEYLPTPLSVEGLLVGYSVVILSFIAGIHWGKAMHHIALDGQVSPHYQTPVSSLIISSNIIALVGWGLLFAPMAWSFIGLGLSFIALLWVDLKWAKFNENASWFWRLRQQASAVAIVAMLSNGLSLL